MKVTSLANLEMHSRFLQLHNPFAPKHPDKLDEDGKIIEQGDYIRPFKKDDLFFGPDGKPLGFQVVPYKSQTMRNAALKRQRALMAATPEDYKDPEFKMKADAALVSSAIIGWSHPEIFGEYSTDRALELISDGNKSHLANQVESFILQERDFFGI